MVQEVSQSSAFAQMAFLLTHPGARLDVPQVGTLTDRHLCIEASDDDAEDAPAH